MDRQEPIYFLHKALKLVGEVEDTDKKEGLGLLEQLLDSKDKQLITHGYGQVIFKELVKLANFESGPTLRYTLQLLKTHYFPVPEHWDELAETLIYRVARSSDREVCQPCLEEISSLVDYFDESIAKHSKQLLKLADLNDVTDFNPMLIEIIAKLETKLPTRKLTL